MYFVAPLNFFSANSSVLCVSLIVHRLLCSHTNTSMMRKCSTYHICFTIFLLLLSMPRVTAHTSVRYKVKPSSLPNSIHTKIYTCKEQHMREQHLYVLLLFDCIKFISFIKLVTLRAMFPSLPASRRSLSIYTFSFAHSGSPLMITQIIINVHISLFVHYIIYIWMYA